jgi:uncharacterized membrane protein YvbJ
MALIKCSECGNQVSDKARACIHCGAPISESNNKKENVTTVQLTSKEIKKQGCIYPLLLFFLGLIVYAAQGGGQNTGIPMIIFSLAFILFMIGVVRSWWHHG